MRRCPSSNAVEHCIREQPLGECALAALQERFQSLDRRLRELQATCDAQEAMYRAFADGAATRRSDLNRIRQLVQQQVGHEACSQAPMLPPMLPQGWLVAASRALGFTTLAGT